MIFLRTNVPLFLLILVGFAVITCSSETGTSKASENVLRLATTTSTVDSGLFTILIPIFEKKENISVTILARGTGAALELARKGKADVLLAHARKSEDLFIREGFGVNRRDVMYNQFLLLGPPTDPAGIKSSDGITRAFSKIKATRALFISRGDNSGTHLREKSFWKLAGVKPEGAWYLESKAGMLSTLKKAEKRKAYVLSDSGTFIFNKEKLNLVSIQHKDKRLLNPYGVIAVNPAKISGVNFKGAMKFIEFLTSIEGQELIAGYGKIRFGKPLFQPVTLPRYK